MTLFLLRCGDAEDELLQSAYVQATERVDDRQRLLVYLVAWQLLGLLLTMGLRQGASWVEAAAFFLPLCAIYAFVCLSAWYLCRAFPMNTATGMSASVRSARPRLNGPEASACGVVAIGRSGTIADAASPTTRAYTTGVFGAGPGAMQACQSAWIR